MDAPRNGGRPGNDLIESCAKAVDVRFSGQHKTLNLLWRHETGRPLRFPFTVHQLGKEALS